MVFEKARRRLAVEIGAPDENRKIIDAVYFAGKGGNAVIMGPRGIIVKRDQSPVIGMQQCLHETGDTEAPVDQIKIAGA